ncbi:MAG TPA: CoA transferase [Myxococcota bacterium]|nr:CoA transferase [Myxococcota bacterium]
MSARSDADRSGALAGLRVAELASEATAFAGKLMSDMGADVIVIEPPAGSELRSRPPFVDDVVDPEKSLTWWHYNTNKRGVTLDLDTASDRERLRQLLLSVDVVLEGEAPGRLSSLGLDYADLRSAKRELVMVSITPFGRGDPREHEPVTDLTLLAGGGPVWSCGYDDHSLPPIRGWGNQSYNIGALYAVIGTLVAILVRDEQGIGQHVDVNLNASANVTTEQATYTWLVTRQTVQRQTGRHAEILPSLPTQVRCSDGRWVNTGVPPRVRDEFAAVHEWLRELGLLEEFTDRVFLELGMERERLDLSKLGEDVEVQAMFAAGREAMTLIASRLPSYEFFMEAHRRQMPVAIIYSPEETLQDSHFVVRGFPTRIDHDDLGRSILYPGAPIRFTGSPSRIRSRAPHLGEHNSEVFAEIETGADD